MPFRQCRRAVTAGVAAIALCFPAVARADSVRMWDHANFGGASFVPATYQPDFRKAGCSWYCISWNGRVSSLHVPAYTCVTLFSLAYYAGEQRTYCGHNVAGQGAPRDYAYLDGFNDRASSSQTWGEIKQH